MAEPRSRLLSRESRAHARQTGGGFQMRLSARSRATDLQPAHNDDRQRCVHYDGDSHMTAESDNSTGRKGPRMFWHLADEDEPTFDPRLEPAVGLLHGMRAQRDQLVALRDAISRGECDALTVSQALTEGFAVHAQAAAELPTALERAAAFVRDIPAEMANVRRQYIESCQHDPAAGKLLPVGFKGSTRKGARLGYFKSPLRDGTFGYLQRRSEDCMQAAIASFLQAPPYTVPDLELGKLRAAGKDPEEIERLIAQKLDRWAEKNAVTFVAYTTRLPTSSGRWIGVVEGIDNSDGHCLLMDGRSVIFDTAWLTPPRKGEALSWHGLDDISIGITIERK